MGATFLILTDFSLFFFCISNAFWCLICCIKNEGSWNKNKPYKSFDSEKVIAQSPLFHSSSIQLINNTTCCLLLWIILTMFCTHYIIDWAEKECILSFKENNWKKNQQNLSNGESFKFKLNYILYYLFCHLLWWYSFI